MYRWIYYLIHGKFPCEHVFENYKLISFDAKRFGVSRYVSEHFFAIKIIGKCKCGEYDSKTFSTTAVDSEFALERDKKYNLPILMRYITAEYGIDFEGTDVHVNT